MSLAETVWTDDNSDELLFENSTCTIAGGSRAFDTNTSFEFGDHSSYSYSKRPDHSDRRPIILNHGYAAFGDQQHVEYSGANQNTYAADNLQHHVEQSVISDSGECHDRSVLELKSDTFGPTSKTLPVWVCLVLTKLFQKLGHIPNQKTHGRPIGLSDGEGWPYEVDD